MSNTWAWVISCEDNNYEGEFFFVTINLWVQHYNRQTCHKLCKSIKLGIRKETLKKNSVDEFFSKLQNGELNQDGVSNYCYFSFGSHTVISQPILKCKTILNSIIGKSAAKDY
jgi:hypothetical protein